MEGRQTREPDLERGVSGLPVRAKAVPSYHPEMASVLDSDDGFMLCRRYSTLHARYLLEHPHLFEHRYQRSKFGETIATQLFPYSR